MRTLNNTNPTKTSSYYAKLSINSSSTHYNCSPAQRMNLNLIYPYNASNRVNHSFINRGSDHVHTDHTPNDPTCTEPPNSHMPGAQAWRSVKRRHAKAASRWLGGSMMAYEHRTTLTNHGNHERMSKHTTLPRSELFVGFRFIVFSASERALPSTGFQLPGGCEGLEKHA